MEYIPPMFWIFIGLGIAFAFILAGVGICSYLEERGNYWRAKAQKLQ